jgi:hypothetical protein
VPSSRTSRTAKQASDRVKALPWAAIAGAGVAVGKRWSALSAKERQRLTALVRDSRGRVGNLSSKERSELKRLVGKLDLKGAMRELLPLVRGGKRGRKRS